MERRTSPRNGALDDAMRALRAELEHRVIDSTNDPRLQNLVARVASEGRAAGLSEEHVVMAFRRWWDGARPLIPRSTPAQLGGLRWKALADLISVYYARNDSATA